MTYYQDKDLTIRPMLPSDCQAFYESFTAHDWHKPLAQFQRYFQEQEQGVKRILVAAWQGEVAGYTTLLPQARAIAEQRTAPELLSACRLIQEALDDCWANVGVGNICAGLLARL